MKKSLLVLLAAALCSGTVFAEDAASVLKKVKARQERFKAEFKDVKILMDTKMSAEGNDMAGTLEVFTKGGKRRTEMSMMGMKTVIINDGKDIWLISPHQGRKKLNDEKDGGAGTSPFGWAESISDSGASVSEGTEAGKPCYVIEGTDKAGNKGKWSISKDSLALLRFEGASKNGDVVYVNSDFRKVKGDLEIPYKMNAMSGGKPVMETVVKSFEADKGMSDDIFNPEKVKQEDLGKMDMNMMMKMMQNRGK